MKTAIILVGVVLMVVGYIVALWVVPDIVGWVD
jgi:hypothetical protein